MLWPEGTVVWTRCGPQPAITADNERRDEERRPDARTSFRDSTRSASVVPRTPITAAGVSRRMASGESLAIRPETYAMTPRTTFSTRPNRPSAGAYTNSSTRTSLLGPSETRVSSFNVTPSRPSAPVRRVSASKIG